MNTPLDSYLAYKLSGRTVTDEVASEPACKLCQDQGTPGEELAIGDGELVYAVACWEEWSGWELFGVYHAKHSLSDIVASNPPRPTAILKGRIQETSYETNGEHDAGTYTLASLSLYTVNYPSSLGHDA